MPNIDLAAFYTPLVEKTHSTGGRKESKSTRLPTILSVKDASFMYDKSRSREGVDLTEDIIDFKLDSVDFEVKKVKPRIIFFNKKTKLTLQELYFRVTYFAWKVQLVAVKALC